MAPLTPEFDAAQHQTYVDHLNEAIQDPKIRNIALTGRYGAGKSSILEQFANQPSMRKRVLPLALSTLGPERPQASDDASPQQAADSTTNRIEKELVKQLLHREKPSRLRQSRYQRIEVLPKWHAVVEAVVVVGALAAFLWGLGALPTVPGASGDHEWVVRVAAVIAVVVTPVALVAWVRLAIHSRFAISELSAAGASISLTRSGSYFDEYLDEIVYFFETARNVDLVLFEDLDRFDDPGIFEALRELNTLLNSSKQMGGRTIRFVYALRDSVFERLGRDESAGADGAVHAEATRANRTKFFDLVVPIVPFITHRNARDLLTQVLHDDRHGAVAPVSPELIDLTARYLPDMRLLRNIRNEYSVFAQRLIGEQHGVRSLKPDQLFALIVYKNIHLADFEDILLGRSKVDELYRFSRQLVAEAIGSRRARLRELAEEVALPQALARRAARCGHQLTWYVEEVRRAKESARALGHSVVGYRVGGVDFDASSVGDVEFWRTVASTGSGVTIKYERQGNLEPFELDMQGIARLTSEEHSAMDWDTVEASALARERAQIESEVAVLRTADFVELHRHPHFRTSAGQEARSFSDVLVTTVDSELGRALISQGYIDRYYTLYIAQYYGDHVPPNAMNFIVQNVDTNRSDVDYAFADDEEVAALLRETKRSFLTEKSAYNIAILDYLFEHDRAGAATVLDAIANRFGEEERTFLDAYFAAGASTLEVASYLGRTWPRTLSYLVSDAEVTSEARLDLVGSALAGARDDLKYEINDAVRTYLQQNQGNLGILTQEPGEGKVGSRSSPEEVARAVALASRAGVVFDDLSVMSPTARTHAVASDSYALTHANLRTILGEQVGLSLDAIAVTNRPVYEDCLRQVNEYLAALLGERGSEAEAGLASPDESGQTTDDVWTVQNPAAFAEVVTDLVALAGAVPSRVLRGAHPDCVVEDLTDVPASVWGAVADAGRMRPTLRNVDLYLQEFGAIDSSLGSTLALSDRILEVQDGDAAAEGDEASDHDTRSRVASAILNESDHLPDPSTRVRLASSLGIGDWFPLSQVDPASGRLLGHLISAQIWSDEASLVAHFGSQDWGTLCFAIQQSTSFAEYVVPALLPPTMTTELLTSDEIHADVKTAVLKRFEEFVDVSSSAGLVAAGRAALSTGTLLAPANIASIAAGSGDSGLVVRLLDAHGRSLDAEVLRSTLSQLPPPYRQLVEQGASLKFPRDPAHEAVLKRIHQGGLISARSLKGGVLKPARIEVSVR